MRPVILTIALLLSTVASGQQRFIQFVYTSDSHYGIEREFRGENDVSASEVNRAMIEKINALPDAELPRDGGTRSGERIEWVDLVINTGDIANRAEDGVQPSRRSWRQFRRDWSRIELRNEDSTTAPLMLLPGNHDISNAIGHPSIPRRKVDATAAAEIYNAMLKPSIPLTKRTYMRDIHLCNYLFDAGEVHLAFLDMWPDTRNREWLGKEMKDAPGNAIWLLFTHDQPDVEAKHLRSPDGGFEGGFENLTGDVATVDDVHEAPSLQRAELAEFMDAHHSIEGYFHGNENYNEFYVWHGPESAFGSDPDNRNTLPVFRVDSPMKGLTSYYDEALLSFQFVVIDTQTRRMTVRECLWNRGDEVMWGDSTTIEL